MTEPKPFKPEGISPPAFWSALTAADVETLAAQNGGRFFAGAEVVAVARRCRFGFPQTVVSSPLTRDIKPFPTLFWLTCPFLKRRCGELESMRKIAELAKILSSMPEEVARYHASYAEARLSLVPPDTRRALQSSSPAIFAVVAESGVGGADRSRGAFAPKCLHLHTAAWLGMGRHPASKWLEAEIGALECASGVCRPPAKEA